MSSPELPQLADDFWLSAHDTVNGKPRLAARPLDIGLATALLVELLFTGNITVQDGLMHPQFVAMPEDTALQPIARLIDEEDKAQRRQAGVSHRQVGLNVLEWIKYLSIDGRAAALVTDRLSRRGLAILEQRRKMFGGQVQRFVPRDSYASGSPAVRVVTGVQRRETLDQGTRAFAGLLLATGLHQHAFETLSSDDRARLGEQLRSMHPMLRELLRHGEQVVGEEVMNR